MKYLFFFIVILILGAAARPGISYLSKNKARTGLSDNQFIACPDTPNCVSSMTADNAHKIEALSLSDNPALSLDSIAALIKQQTNTQIVTLESGYLHATYKTKVLGFIDDVEMLQLPQSDVIEVKSASRLGRSDFGINRKRIEELRNTLKLQTD